jgi:hypothetical protein
VLKNRATAAVAAPCYGNESKHFAKHVDDCASKYSMSSNSSSSSSGVQSASCASTNGHWLSASSSSSSICGVNYSMISNSSSSSSNSISSKDAAVTTQCGYNPLARACSFTETYSSTNDSYSDTAGAAAGYNYSDSSDCFDKIAAECNSSLFEQQLQSDSSVADDIDSDELLAVLQDAFLHDSDSNATAAFDALMYSNDDLQLNSSTFEDTTTATTATDSANAFRM